MEHAEKLEEEYKLDEYDDNDDEDEATVRIRGEWHVQLLTAARKGEYEFCEKCLTKKANFLYEDKKKWSALTWAACKGHLKIVKLLLSRGAAEPYVNTPEAARKVITGAINIEAKPTPLQWAAFKGYLQIVWLLLKAGLRWEDVDSFGNNTINLAAAGGHLRIFECILQVGVNLNIRNSRGHCCLDLSTTLEINQLIGVYHATQDCSRCKVAMHDYDLKYYCITCRKFFCGDCHEVRWVLEHEKSEARDKLEGRCKDCWSITARHEEELARIIESNNYNFLKEKLAEVKAIDQQIDVSLHAQALVHL
jgi:hypothetical protein